MKANRNAFRFRKRKRSKHTMAKTKAFKPKARRPRGFEDRSARVLRAERALVSAASAVYERWGFEPLETPAFEYADALGKFLPDEERPNEGVFAMQDDDEQWMALRYDLTAPLARFAAENFQDLAKPFRRYQFGEVWRNEKPGPGRFRQFVQCDADSVGAGGPAADAEMIALASEVMGAAGLGADDFVIRVNDRRLLDGVLEQLGDAAADKRLRVLRAIDKLDRLGLEGVELLLGEGRKDESGDFTEGAGLDGEQRRKVLSFVDIQNTTADASDRTRETLDRLAASLGETQAGRAAVDDLEAITELLPTGFWTPLWCAGWAIIPGRFLKRNCAPRPPMKMARRCALGRSVAGAVMTIWWRALPVRLCPPRASALGCLVLPRRFPLWADLIALKPTRLSWWSRRKKTVWRTTSSWPGSCARPDCGPRPLWAVGIWASSSNMPTDAERRLP